MRRTEHLLEELRNSTDSVDTTALKDAELITYLNYGQRLIQNIIFRQNPKADIFKKKVTYSYSESGEYSLPSDIFAENAISLVEYKNGDKYYPVSRIGEEEFGSAGYFTEDKKLIVRGYQYFDLRVTCFRKLPKMDKRWGKIQAVNSGVSLVLETGYSEGADKIDDYITVVNRFGAQVLPSVLIDAFSGATWETTNALTDAAVGDYVCLGDNTVNAAELPDDCETYLLDYARKRIMSRNNYDDGNKQADLTGEQKSEIAALFANNQKDVLYPAITDHDSLDF